MDGQEMFSPIMTIKIFFCSLHAKFYCSSAFFVNSYSLQLFTMEIETLFFSVSRSRAFKFQSIGKSS